jgi:hypothetical protein
MAVYTSGLDEDDLSRLQFQVLLLLRFGVLECHCIE